MMPKGYDTNYDGQNQIYTVLLGDMIEPGTEIDTPFNHYSLMKTIENNFGIGSLKKNDQDANYFRFLWGQKFEWSSEQSIDVLSSGNVSGACLGSELILGVKEGDNLQLYRESLGNWTATDVLQNVSDNFSFSTFENFCIDVLC